MTTQHGCCDSSSEWALGGPATTLPLYFATSLGQGPDLPDLTSHLLEERPLSPPPVPLDARELVDLDGLMRAIRAHRVVDRGGDFFPVVPAICPATAERMLSAREAGLPTGLAANVVKGSVALVSAIGALMATILGLV